MKRLAEYLKRSPEDATADELREFQIAMGQQGASPTTINSRDKRQTGDLYLQGLSAKRKQSAQNHAARHR